MNGVQKCSNLASGTAECDIEYDCESQLFELQLTGADTRNFIP
jgi:hypothetical protein